MYAQIRFTHFGLVTCLLILLLILVLPLVLSFSLLILTFSLPGACELLPQPLIWSLWWLTLYLYIVCSQNGKCPQTFDHVPTPTRCPTHRRKLLSCLLRRAWASPTLAWLHCAHACVCLLACLDRPLTVNFKWAHSNISQGLTVHGKMYTSAKPWEWEWTVTSISVKLSGSKDDSSSVRLHHARKHLVWTTS